jgi:SAM-dependent methyltransferase
VRLQLGAGRVDKLQTFDQNCSMQSFLNRSRPKLIESPNGCPWWHSAPLPGGRRTKGAHPDQDRQFKMWDAMQMPSLAGLRVLDIGANDGFFSIAAATQGAVVTSVNSTDWIGWPRNIHYLAEQWGVAPAVITGDFREHDFGGQAFDVILLLGVIYHVENVFGVMRQLKSLMAPGGRLYIETHLSPIGGDIPVWEAASDIFPTSAPQGKELVGQVGLSNFLLPNVNAVVNLADTYELSCQPLLDNDYCREDPGRGMFIIRSPQSTAI